MSKIPKVYLVGSGSGDYELLTIKAKRLIETCDVLIYDHLVNTDIVKLASNDCEKIYVGKKANCHTLKQEKINKLLIDKFNQQKTVVRLKGGDPIIFGRGGEEAQELVKEKVPFEIIPGISSSIAAPIYAGIPVTHREYNSCFTILTGHEDPTKEESFIDWKNLANFNGPLIILMGIKNLPKITKQLISKGRNPEEPTAIVQQGTTPFQKVVTSTLKDIAKIAKTNNIQPPGILVIGENVNLRKDLCWFENLPLFGKNILITRPLEQSYELKNKLSVLGANVINLPSIKIRHLSNYNTVDKSIKSITQFDWLIFTSVNGVNSFFNRLTELKLDSRHLASLKIAAIGNITAKNLLNYGIKADFIPEKYTSECIVEGLSQLNEINQKHFLLARSDIARVEITKALSNKGAKVTDLVTYKILEENIESQISEIFKKEKIDLITFTSPSTAESFHKQLSKNILEIITNNTIIASIGPVTSNTCLQIFNKVNIEATIHNIDGLIEAIVKHYNNI